jgi:type I restriction enzyme S subunit
MNKNVPEIRFKGFNEEWDENYLGELIDIGSAARVHKEQWTEAGVPFFRTSDVVSIYKGQPNKEAFISHELYQELSDKIGKVANGDLLITGGGSIGIPYLITNDDPLYFKDADVLWLKNNQKLDGHFLYTFFFSLPFKKHIKSISHIGTIGHYTISQAKSTPISTCERNEQTQIGSYFQELDKLISQHQQKHDKLSNIKSAMLVKMFPESGETIPEIRFKGFNGDWEEKELHEVANYRNGKAHEQAINPNGKFVVVNSKFVSTNGKVKKNSIQQISPMSKNEIAFVLSDVPNGKALARTFLINSDYLYTLNQRIAGITPDECTHHYFLHILLNRNPYFLKFDDGAKQTNLSVSDVEQFKSFYPTHDEQTKIGNYFQELDKLISQHQQQITKLNNIKQACLNKMFV